MVNRIHIALVFLATLTASPAVTANSVADSFYEQMSRHWPSPLPSSTPVEMKFSSPAPGSSLKPSIWNKGLDELQGHFRGNFEVRQFHSGSLHGVHHGFKAVRSGNSDFATCYTNVSPRYFLLSTVWSLPFIVPNNSVVATRISLELAPEYFKPEFEGQDVYYGHQQVSTPANIMSRVPIRSLEDIKGLKIGGSGIQTEIIRALGAIPVPLTFPEYYVALQRGVIDGLLWSDVPFVAYRIPEVAKYYVEIGLGSVGLDYCIRKEFFDTLPASMKQAFYLYNQSMAVAEAYFSDEGVRHLIDPAFKENGVVTTTLSEEERKRWQDAAKPVIDAWLHRAEEQGLPGRQLLEDIEALSEQYSDMNSEQIMQLSIDKPVHGIIDGL